MKLDRETLDHYLLQVEAIDHVSGREARRKYEVVWFITRLMYFLYKNHIFSAANLALAGFPLTNALGESMPSRHLNMLNLHLCNAATIRYSQLKFGHKHLCGMDYKDFLPHCCKCNSFGCTAAIRCGNACHGPHGDSLYSGSEHSQFNSPRLVKREAGFPNPRWALIGSNQLWRVNDSPYYREYTVVVFWLFCFCTYKFLFCHVS